MLRRNIMIHACQGFKLRGHHLLLYHPPLSFLVVRELERSDLEGIGGAKGRRQVEGVMI